MEVNTQSWFGTQNEVGSDPAFGSLTAVNVGDVPAAIKKGPTITSDCVKATEIGAGPFRKVRLDLTDLEVTMVDNAGVGAYGGVQIYDMPKGFQQIVGAVADLTVEKSGAGIDATFDGDFGLGTIVANNTATPLAGAEQDILPNTAMPQGVAGLTTAQGYQSTSPVATVRDGHTTALDVFLNALIDDADQDGGGTLIFNGWIEITYIDLGTI
jgi:hypothetical protein